MRFWDTILSFCAFLFLGFIFYYVIFRAPASDEFFSAETDSEIEKMRNYLQQNGIKTYIKNKSSNRAVTKSGPADPSLHVVNLKYRDKAIQLLRNMAK